MHPPRMMAKSWAESTWEITNYGRSINQYGNSKGLTKKYVVKKCLLCSIKYISKKKCCQNIYTYICVCVYVCVCVCLCLCGGR